jgi:hypothetical protein
MKRLLILFILISFVTVSCAGRQVKYRWTKPDFISQEQFEKDRQECIDSIDRDGLSSVDFQKAFDECFAKKGYERPQEKEYPIGVKILVGVGIVAVVVVAGAALAALLFFGAIGGGHF